jgi:hypothetical protein
MFMLLASMQTRLIFSGPWLRMERPITSPGCWPAILT